MGQLTLKYQLDAPCDHCKLALNLKLSLSKVLEL